MSIRSFVILVLFPCVFHCSLFSQTIHANLNVGVAEFINTLSSDKAFTTKPVTEKQIELILKCGIKAPSARNLQPWRFTVVKDIKKMNQVIPDIQDGNVLIVISGQEKSPYSIEFDCALATENMFIAAKALGLGARIYAGPVSKVNANLRDTLAIPVGFRVVSILRIGALDKAVDAETAATSRKRFSEIVNYE
jgi:nitroreductase